ncbi:Ig-like domain-containing protein [Treponema socranskii]|uniref:Ig-like domain-containing protein n=1 Tax=Treponema socranskii TaxID=53419 RepID=UPI003D6F8F46
MKRIAGALISISLFFSCNVISFDEYEVTCSQSPAEKYFAGEHIGFSFNCDVVRHYAEQAVTIKSGTHQYEAEYAWNGRSLYVKPSGGWVYGKPYQVSIDGLMHTENDATFHAYTICTFIYGNEVERFYALALPEKRIGADVRQKLVFSFNKKIEAARFEKAFSILPSAEYSIALSEDKRTITVSPSPKWKLNTTYAWTVQPFLSSDDREIQDLLSNTFSTTEDAESPMLVSLCPVTDTSPDAHWLTDIALDKHISGKQPIGFVFSKPMDFDSVKDAVSISPSLPGYMVPSGDEGTHFLFVPEEYYKLATEYTLGIAVSATDENDTPLFEKIVTRFYAADAWLSVAGLSLDADDVSDLSAPCIEHRLHKNADGNYELTARILFSHAIADGALTVASNAVTASLLFPLTSASPVKTGVFWNEEKTRLTITWTRFTVSTDDVSSYYRLKIAGGPAGINDGEGSYMEKDLCITVLAKQ